MCESSYIVSHSLPPDDVLTCHSVGILLSCYPAGNVPVSIFGWSAYMCSDIRYVLLILHVMDAYCHLLNISMPSFPRLMLNVTCLRNDVLCAFLNLERPVLLRWIFTMTVHGLLRFMFQ